MDYKVVLMNMPVAVRATVVYVDDFYTIIVNARLSVEQQREAFIHELKHIYGNDFEKCNACEIEHYTHKKASTLIA